MKRHKTRPTMSVSLCTYAVIVCNPTRGTSSFSSKKYHLGPGNAIQRHTQHHAIKLFLKLTFSNFPLLFKKKKKRRLAYFCELVWLPGINSLPSKDSMAIHLCSYHNDNTPHLYYKRRNAGVINSSAPRLTDMRYGDEVIKWQNLSCKTAALLKRSSIFLICVITISVLEYSLTIHRNSAVWVGSHGLDWKIHHDFCNWLLCSYLWSENSLFSSIPIQIFSWDLLQIRLFCWIHSSHIT